VSLTDPRGNKGIITQELIRQEHLVTKVEQAASRKDRAVGAVRRGELAVLFAESLERIGMCVELPTPLLILRKFEPQRLRARAKVRCKRTDLIGTNTLLFCSRDVSGNITEKSGRITERGESREAEFK
jgi:hypothetical protein